jgi:hypothetical protein
LVEERWGLVIPTQPGETWSESLSTPYHKADGTSLDGRVTYAKGNLPTTFFNPNFLTDAEKAELLGKNYRLFSKTNNQVDPAQLEATVVLEETNFVRRYHFLPYQPKNRKS